MRALLVGCLEIFIFKKVCHSLKQKEYLYWKYNIFEDFCQTTKPPYLDLVEKKKKNNKIESLKKLDSSYQSYLFYTSYKKEFQRFHSDWYTFVSKDNSGLINTAPLSSNEQRFCKRLPLNITQLLTDPLALAIWYLDDGTKRTDTESCRFASHTFSKDEHELLCDCMYKNFGITPKIESWGRNKAGATAYSLALLSRGGHYQKFRDLVYPIVQVEVPSMLYKL